MHLHRKAKAFVDRGFRSRAFDRKTCPEEDFSEKMGFAKAVFYILRVKEKGIVGAGPQCSTWIFIGFSHTMRNLAIQGDESRADVRASDMRGICLSWAC